MPRELVTELLNQNSDGSSWQRVAAPNMVSKWDRRDGKFSAFYDPLDHYLVLSAAKVDESAFEDATPKPAMVPSSRLVEPPSAGARAISLPDKLSVGGQTYKNAVYRSHNEWLLNIAHDTGAASLPIASLSSDLQKVLGYDEKRAATASAQHAEQAKKAEAEQRAEAAGAQEAKEQAQSRQDLERYVDGRSIRKPLVLSILQPLDFGCLVFVRAASGKAASDVLHWIDGSELIFTDSDAVKVPALFWAGTYSYTTIEGIPRVIDSYSSDRNRAIELFARRAGQPTEPSPEEKREAGSSGSGFFVTTNGYLVTNHHVIDGAKRLRIRTKEGIKDARVVSTDPANDLAILKIDASTKALSLAKGGGVKAGERVLAVGFPMPDLQGFSPKVTAGVVSSLSGFKDDVTMLQIDAAVQPGNSGGPLINEKGQVVGVIVARLNDKDAQNVNYAVKVSYLRALLESAPEVAEHLVEGVEASGDNAAELAISACAFVQTSEE
jgi:S1-C subfamily serine protease